MRNVTSKKDSAPMVLQVMDSPVKTGVFRSNRPFATPVANGGFVLTDSARKAQ